MHRVIVKYLRIRNVYKACIKVDDITYILGTFKHESDAYTACDNFLQKSDLKINESHL